MQKRGPLPPLTRSGQHRDGDHNQKPARNLNHSVKPFKSLRLEPRGRSQFLFSFVLFLFASTADKFTFGNAAGQYADLERSKSEQITSAQAADSLANR